MDKKQTWIESLNEREIEILALISDGMSNREIAQKLNLSLETVKWYNKKIYSKLGANSRTQALAIANEQQLLQLREEVDAPSTNLPMQLTSFVGRSREIAEIQELLRSSRLVTLTGPGGTGKTRLALQVAEMVASYFPDGVILVELSSVSEPTFVANAIAQEVKATLSSGEAPQESLIRSLKDKHALLLLDNFEHLLSAAPLVINLLSAAPLLSVLATSREHLNVTGEQEYSVQPLSLPVNGQADLAQLLAYESADLFIQRAKAVNPRLSLSDTDTPALAQICLRLDGLPLALELAASQVKFFSLERLAQRLQSNLDSLATGPRDRPSRQRTLRATIEWSYNLLDDAEKELFAQLSVFRGGGTLEGIEQVCRVSASRDLVAILSSLVEKNLVRVHEGIDGEIRYSMLETIREFACEQLTSSGNADQVSQSHAEFFAKLAEASGRQFRTERQLYWMPRIRAEQDNLRAALAWSLEGSEVAYGVRIASFLLTYWYYNGFGVEGEYWTDHALLKLTSVPPDLQAALLKSAGVIAYGNADLQKARNYHLKALELDRELNDELNMGFSLSFLAMTYVGSPTDYEQALDLGMEGLEMLRKQENLPGVAQALNIMGELTRVAGDLDAAQRYYTDALDVVDQTGETLREGMLLINLGVIALKMKEYQQALRLMRESLTAYLKLSNGYHIASALGFFAGPMAALGQPERAVEMLGASDRALERLDMTQQPADQIDIDWISEDIQSKLGDERFQEAFERGRSLNVEQAVALAYQDF